VIPTKDGRILGEALHMRLQELVIVHMCMLHGFDRPTLAVLYEDPSENR